MDDADKNFMIGRAIKVSPVLDKGATTIESYFPNDYWVDLNTYAVTVSRDDTKGNEGQTVSLPASWEYVNVHLASGHIVPMHNVTKDGVNSTTELVDFATTQLVVHPDANLSASGTIYLDDDGLSRTKFEEDKYQYFDITFGEGSLEFIFRNGTPGKEATSQNEVLEEVLFVRAAELKSYTKACFFQPADEGEDIFQLNVSYNEEKETLSIKPKGGVVMLIQKVTEIYVFDDSTMDDRCSGDVPEGLSNSAIGN